MSFTKVAPAGIGTEPGDGITIGDSFLHTTGIDIGLNTGVGVTIRKNGNATFTGIITAASFSGSGANLTGVASTDNIKTSTTANFTGGIQVSGAVTFTGDVGIAGTLTYEDVSNVDSVGLVTARSGIKIGPTAGVAGTFFADGSYITAGIITATTFHGSGANLTGISAGAGGDTGLDLNDSVKIRLGTGNDFEIFHDGTTNRFQSNGLKNFQFNPKDTDVGLKIIGDGACELYHDGTKRFETSSSGGTLTGTLVTGTVDCSGVIYFGPNNNGRIYTDNNWGTIFQADKASPAVAEFMFQNGGATERLRVDNSGHLLPGADNSQNLGASNKRWQNIYTGDLNLSNKGSTNSVDNTWGDYTIQEGESDLYLINNRNGKKYKFNLTEVN